MNTKNNFNKIKIKKLSQYLNGQQAILGLGIENQALLRLLDRYKIAADFTVCDSRAIDKLQPTIDALKLKHLKLNYQLESEYNRNLSGYRRLWRSPGWPIACPGIKEALRAGASLDSPMNLFFKICPTDNIIGVSGTKGKGTTSSLIYSIIKAAKKKVWLGGNIGIAPLDFVDKTSKKDWVVLELSSFQLEDLHYSPKISVISNIYKEHLAPADPLNPNYHKSFKDYLRAKLNLAQHQKKSDYLLLNDKFKKVFSKENLGPGQKLYFTSSETPSRLYGIFNKENVAAAEMVGSLLKIDTKTIKKAVNKFAGLEHRLELALEKNQVRWFDNSFSTTPESSILDLESFSEPIILLAGGADKGADFKGFAKTIRAKVQNLFLFDGAGSQRLLKELLAIDFPKNKLKIVKSMGEAVNQASKLAKPKSVVLLSTGCASFGLFKNYKDRGNQFKVAVKNI
jgi:UDP-N-acetylmuramoylalanine--D-glutamate ligase